MDDIATHTDALKAEIAQFQAVAPAARKPHLNFAAVWPAAREALALLETMVPFSLRMILSIVLTVGDTVAGTVAGTPAVTPA